MADDKSLILGIDVATANSAAAFLVDEKPEMVVPLEGADPLQGISFPSYVSFDRAGNVKHVGKLAVEDQSHGDLVVWGVKRLVGLGYNEAQRERRLLDYPIVKAEDGGVRIVVGPRQYTPEDIIREILKKIKADLFNPDCNSIGGRPVGKVVVSHPANFTPHRVNLIKESAQKVFPDVPVGTVPEPVAAALAYGVEFSKNKGGKNEAIVCVTDWGAGTLDVVTAVITKDKEGGVFMAPNPAQGKANLGGIDIDDLIMDWVIEKYELEGFKDLHGKPMERDAAGVVDPKFREYRMLRRLIEDNKIRLSERTKTTTFSITYEHEVVDITLTRDDIDEIMKKPLTEEKFKELWEGDVYRLDQAKHKRLILTRDDLYKMAGIAASQQSTNGAGSPPKKDESAELRSSSAGVLPSILDVFKVVVVNSIRQANYKVGDIHQIIMVGGPCKMPCVKEAVMDIFRDNAAVVEQMKRIMANQYPADPMECVAKGAALCAQGKIGSVPVLDRDYHLVRHTQKTKDRTIVYVTEQPLLNLGMPLPCDGSLPDQSLLGTGGVSSVDVTLVDVKVDPLQRDHKQIRRTGGYVFQAVVDASKFARYEIALHAEEDGISVTCHDKNTEERFTFHRISRLDGELLTDDKYDVRFGDPPPELTREDIGQIHAVIPHLLVRATVWMQQKHEPDDEQNRPRVQQLAGELSHLHGDAPKPKDIKWTKNSEGDEVPEDEQVRQQWLAVAQTGIYLQTLLETLQVTPEDLQKERSSALSLRPSVDRILESNAAAKEKEILKQDWARLEQAVKKLPPSLDQPSTERSVRYALTTVKDCIEVVRADVERIGGKTLANH